MAPAFIRTIALRPAPIRLLLLGPICSWFMLILLFVLIVSVYVYLIS